MISPISSSILYNPVSQVKPLNYAISNETGFSDVYATDATKQTQGVNAAPPVIYPNAQSVPVSQTDKLAQTKEADAKFNSLASSFDGNITGYTSDSRGTSYGVVGSSFDAFA